MDSLPDECLIIIFKNLDLRSRLAVAKTCKRWRRLITDPAALMENVSEVYLDKWSPEQEELEIPSVLAVLSHFRNCRLLKLGPGVARGFLLEQRLKDEMVRFKELVLMESRDDNTNLMASCLPLLSSNVKNLRVEDWSPAAFSLKFPDSDHQEDLEMVIQDGGFKTKSFVPNTAVTIMSDDFVVKARFIEPVIEAQDVPVFSTVDSGTYLLRSVQVSPLLSELNVAGLFLSDDSFSAFLRLIRDGAPNLHRISFQDVYYNLPFMTYMESFQNGEEGGMLPFQWIKLDGCLLWSNAAKLLLCVSNVEVLVVKLRDGGPGYFDEEFFDGNFVGLDRPMKEKGVKLELAINVVLPQRDRYDISVSSELRGVLAKLELIDGILLQAVIRDDSFDLLTEIRLEGCVNLSDTELEAVAKWCGNLKKLICQPRDQNDALTDQCLIPFMTYWDDRKSAQLAIECLKPAEPFGGFNLPMDQEKGDFPDGKMWMVFRTAGPLDGGDQFGTRLVIRELEAGKSMIISDYKRSFDIDVQISMIEGRKMHCEREEDRRLQTKIRYQVEIARIASQGWRLHCEREEAKHLK